MKKLLIVFSFIFMLSLPAFSADSLSTVVEGVVPELLTISSDLLPVTTVDVFNKSSSTLGYITIFSNRTGTWSITVTSQNGSKMVGTTPGNPDTYPYTLRFGPTQNINLASPYVANFAGPTSQRGLVYEIGLVYENFWDLQEPVAPDTYRDVITITISAT
ncbi:MAG: hypothetical protein LWX00_04405 [Spirochaetia bacterium]|nr:hypothetical protein [Spirochaetia bacterium]